MKYTKIPENTFKELQLNAGVLTSTFDPANATVSSILAATSGGIDFSAVPSYSDWGSDIDNCQADTLELKKLYSWSVKMSGTFVSVSPAMAKKLAGAADVSSTDSTKVVPRNDVLSTDFSDLWWIGDYSDKNGDTNGGFIAIKMMNTLSTGGFKLKSSDKKKGTFSFEFTAHYSINAKTTVPFEVYIKAGT